MVIVCWAPYLLIMSILELHRIESIILDLKKDLGRIYERTVVYGFPEEFAPDRDIPELLRQVRFLEDTVKDIKSGNKLLNPSRIF